MFNQTKYKKYQTNAVLCSYVVLECTLFVLFNTFVYFVHSLDQNLPNCLIAHTELCFDVSLYVPEIRNLKTSCDGSGTTLVLFIFFTVDSLKLCGIICVGLLQHY
jgi:hypothetical protein